MDYLDRLARAAVIPVVVIDDAKDAEATANALLKGGIDVMEITFRTAAAADAIHAVSEKCPDMLVGAGTIVTLEQCKRAVAVGAKFIVSPGFDDEIVGWCVEHGVTVTPGCVTPTEIMAAKKHGLKIVKFFPANVYGGLQAMKALSAPFGDIKFIPTGGVNADNVGEYISASYVHAIGGSWVCPKGDIAAGNYDRITELSKKARENVLGFQIAHIGINCENEDQAAALCEELSDAFSFSTKNGNSSMFSTSAIEVMKRAYLGVNGHLAVHTNAMLPAIHELEKRGYRIDMTTAKYKGDKMIAVYLEKEFGGFAVHLLQK